MNEILNDLHSLLDYVTKSTPHHRFLPYIAEDINAMINELNDTNIISDKLEKMALGLGIFISDDFEFSESEIGIKILNVVNSIIKSE